MKILVKDISPKGLILNEKVEPADIGLTDDIMTCVSPLTITGKVEKIGQDVLAQTKVTARYSIVCSRCLLPIEKEIAREFDHHFEVDKETKVVDLGEDIRQEMILTYSPVVLCKDDCKGICPGCGASLNTEKCKCKKN